MSQYLELEEAGIHDRVICTPPWDFYIFSNFRKLRFANQEFWVSKFDKSSNQKEACTVVIRFIFSL